MKKIQILFSAAALLGLGACGEAFLDLTPNNEVAVDNVLKTANDFDIAV